MRAPLRRSVVHLKSGECAVWEVRSLLDVLPLAHARTTISGTSVGVAVAGPIADAMDELLARVTRLGASGSGAEDLPSLDQALRIASSAIPG